MAPIQDTVEQLSIAVELKFLLPILPNDAVNSGSEDVPLLEVTSLFDDTTTSKGIERTRLWARAFSIIAKSIEKVPGQHAVTSYDLDARNIQERDCWSSHWIVKKSNSAEPSKSHPHHDDWLWVPVEVNSPRMSWQDPDTIGIIGSVMDAIKARCYVISNHTCEVHIHVGRLDGRPFILPTLKRLAMLVWVTEPELRKVKDPNSPNFGHVYTWSSATREHSRLATDLRLGKVVHVPRAKDLAGLPRQFKDIVWNRKARANNRVFDALCLIATTRSPKQLGKLMSGEGRQYRRLGFNFSAFGGEDERSMTNPRTIECRFLEGTIDNDVVLSWLQIFGRIVEVALDGGGETERFIDTIKSAISNNVDQEATRTHFKETMRMLDITEDVFSPVYKLVRWTTGQAGQNMDRR